MTELSLFQKKCEETLLQRLKILGISIQERILKNIRDERWSTEEEVMIQASIGNIDFWIYDDGAHIQKENINIPFEALDYNSGEELINAFIDTIILLMKQNNINS